MAEELEIEITDLLARVNVPEVKPELNEAWNNQKKTLESKIAKLEQEIDKNQSAIAGNIIIKWIINLINHN